jgi:hypothetical protein
VRQSLSLVAEERLGQSAPRACAGQFGTLCQGRFGVFASRAYAVVNYEQAVKPFLKSDRLSDSGRAILMGGACAKAYRWSPKKG